MSNSSGQSILNSRSRGMDGSQLPGDAISIARSRAIDAQLARHLMLVAMDARAEGDIRLSEHLIETSHYVSDRLHVEVNRVNSDRHVATR